MKVTKVFFKKFENKSMLGFADVSFSLDNGSTTHMTWKGLKLFKGNNGYFVSMPAEQDKKGNKNDDGSPKYWPIISFSKDEDGPHKNLLDAITAAMIKAYEGDKKGSNPSTKKTTQTSASKNVITDEDIPF